MIKEESKKDIINRLRTIKGHIAGIEKMIEEDQKSCEDILVQIAAIRASVHKVGILILENHAIDCLVDQESVCKEELQRVLKTVSKFIK